MSNGILSEKVNESDMNFYDEIVELFPSLDLKAKIKATGHCFSEKELVRIIYEYAPSFDERLRMLEKISEISSPDISAVAKVYIDNEKRKLDEFVTSSEGVVYELCIKETPEAYKEQYLCSSYHAALICIGRFYERYADVDAHETDTTRYTITKRRIISENDIFDEDHCGEMRLGPHKTIIEVSVIDNDHDCRWDDKCSGCQELCPHRYEDVEPLFPCFVHNKALIKYRDYDLNEHFGVCLCSDGDECNGFTTEVYVIPLDSGTIRERRFDDDFYDHEHIQLPNLTLADPAELDDVARKNYFDFIAYLESGKRK